MREWLSERWEIIKAVLSRRWFKIAFVFWTIVGAYDLLGAQILPEFVANKLPRVRDIVGMTTGWLAWWAWGWIGTALLAGAAVE
jgi:hypothetical protein